MQQDVPYLPELLSVSTREAMVAWGLGEEARVSSAAFLTAINGNVKVAKSQLVGPVTASRFGRAHVVEHLSVKAAAMARELLAANVTPMIFFDEPSLGEGELPRAELELVRRAASDAGAIVGLHCCA